MITTFSELQLAVQRVIEDDSTEVLDYIPTAIFLAEDRLAKDLDLQTLRVTSNTASSQQVSIPGGGFETIVSTCISDNGFLYFDHVFQCGDKLDHVDYSFTKEINQHEVSIGVSAQFYSFKNSPNVIYIAPPTSGGSYEIVYTKRPTKLSGSNPSNDIIVKAPTLLFYATMVEMSTFLKHWETISIWQNLYNTGLQTELNTSRRERTEVGQKHSGVDETQSTTGGQ